MTDLVARLREALDAHSAALDAYERHRTDGPHLNYAGQEPEAYDGYDSCYLCVATSAAMPFADVAFGRRMVEAHRKILDLHAPSEYRMIRGGVTHVILQCDHCASLCHSGSGLSCDEPCDAPYPCETVQIVAEYYEVEA